MTDDESTVTLIVTLLGEGDFTYSLDLARYLSSKANEKSTKVSLVPTGIDSQEELFAKYKDAPYILNQLVQTQQSEKLSVTIQHDINAIVEKVQEDKPPFGNGRAADHVLFHHPHLGTEDATLHGRFLCHLFHSCTSVWMKSNGGLLHLTLVDGQFERWNCEQAAKRQGLELLHRRPFVPPPVPNPTYHYRRHQTGKSFESRRPSGSETFIFGRESDQQSHESLKLLSWSDSTGIALSDKANAEIPGPSKNPSYLSCPHCDRTFNEERSRKSHVRAKHPDASEKKAKTTANCFSCIQCEEEAGESRSFDSQQALKDHIQAKHAAIHKSILPDWCRPENKDTSNDETSRKKTSGVHSTCSICGAVFDSPMAEAAHWTDFEPTTQGKDTFQCRFCNKSFREERAKLQHENFCRERAN